MLKTLLKKEIILEKNHLKLNLKKNIFNSIFSLLIILGIFSCLFFTYLELNKRFIYYDCSDEFYIFSLFLVVLVSSFFSLNSFKNKIFAKDLESLEKTLPISLKDNVISKLLSLYFKNFIFIFISSLPLSIAFQITKEISFVFYILYFIIIFFLPFIALFFDSLIIFPYHFIKEFLNKYRLALLITSILFIFLFAYLYYEFFSIFIGLINNDRLNSIFNIEFIENFKSFINYLIPFSFIKSFLIDFKILSLLFLILVVGLFIFLTYLITYYIKKNIKERDYYKLSLKKKEVKLNSLNKALYKKEFLLLTRNNSSFISYCLFSLLVSSFAVLISILFKELINDEFLLQANISINFPLTLLISSLFLGVISSNGCDVISRESNYFTLLNVLPIRLKKLMNTKLIISYSFGLISIILTSILLLIFNVLSLLEILVITVFLSLMILANNTLGIILDLKKPSTENKDSSVSIILISLIISFIITIGSFILIYFTDKTFMTLILGSLLLLYFLIMIYEYHKMIKKYEMKHYFN